MHEFIMDAIEKTLKDWGVDWKLNNSDPSDFKNMMGELELAISKVIN